MFELNDCFAIDDAAAVRYTGDGYMVATPRVARTGIQLYRGSELKRADMDVVRVYRPESSVFDAKALNSFAHKPVTDNHPPEQVNAKNWKLYARGSSGDDVVRDGQFIRVPMTLQDADQIERFKLGKAELSVGYTCDVKFGAGVTADGQAYDAIQTDIRANHIAIVDAARGGKDLRIGDGTGVVLNMSAMASAISAISKGAVNDSDSLVDGDGFLATATKGYPLFKGDTLYVDGLRAAIAKAIIAKDGDIQIACESLMALIDEAALANVGDANIEGLIDMTKIVLIDGVNVTFADEQSAQIVQRTIATHDNKFAEMLKAKKAAEDDSEETKKKKATDDAANVALIATKDAEIATLRKQVADSEMTPAKLDALVADRKIVSDKAIKLLPTLVVDGKSDADIRRQLVDAKLGAVAKGWTDAQVQVSFDTLVAGVTIDAAVTPGYVRAAQAFATPAQVQDSESKIAARDKRLESAWKGNAGVA